MQKILIASFALVIIVVAFSSNASAQLCGQSMEWSECGSPCPEHCPARDAKTGKLTTGLENGCIEICMSGCVCEKGYVQDLKRNSECVLRAKCSAP